MAGKRATLLFNSICSSVAKQVARFCCPFFRTLYTKKSQISDLCNNNINVKDRFEALETRSAYHWYGNFGQKFLSNGTGIFSGTENRNGIELYHLQNTGKFFAFFRLEAWPW